MIVNVIKGAWGYRCEYCSIDVHKACIMKAMTRCECKRVASSDEAEADDADTSVAVKGQLPRVQRNGVSFKVLNSSVSRLAGELFVNFQGLHLCTKQCQQDKNFHAKNIFEGDTYCRLVFEGVVHETSPVLKSADPMYHERVCFKSRYRNSTFRIEIIDFNSDTCIGEMAITLFQLLQHDADRFVRSNPVLNKLRAPLRRLSFVDDVPHATDDSIISSEELSSELSEHERDRYDLTAPAANAKGSGAEKKKIGFALLTVEYVEAKEDLLRLRLNEDDILLELEQKEVTVESLRNTVDRFSRVIRTFQWVDMEYADIIMWKDKKKSAICLAIFVLCCVFVNLEYVGAYIMFGVLLYMLYQLHLRLEGTFVKHWIGFVDYETEQVDQLKVYRPLAELRVAVHDATLSAKTDELLVKTQSEVKELASAKLSYYVRIKYLPNDRKRSEVGGGTRFIPSGYDETIVAWTHAVDKSRHPVWRNVAALENATSHPTASTFAPQFISKQRKEFPLRNVNISWRHNPSTCDCARCAAVAQKSPVRASEDATGSPRSSALSDACGIDHHAFYFRIPQACRKNFAGRDDLASWRLFPGILQFELCISLNGEAKETPDLVVASGSIPLKEVDTRANANQEISLPLSASLPGSPSRSGNNSPTASSNSSKVVATNESEDDRLRVRVDFQVPSTRAGDPRPRRGSAEDSGSISSTIPLLQRRKPLNVSRAERTVSELVCESLVEKESTAVIGAHFLDAFWKIKDTLRNVQNEISTVCGKVACVENLLNWTHPWKTGTAFVVVFVAMVVFSFIPGRWLVLAFGLSEFGAGFIEDLPPSNHARNIFWNFLSSVPTDQDLLDVYEVERELYTTKQQEKREREEEEMRRLRHHALWTGPVLSKGENERSYKVCTVRCPCERVRCEGTDACAAVCCSDVLHGVPSVPLCAMEERGRRRERRAATASADCTLSVVRYASHMASSASLTLLACCSSSAPRRS